MIVAKSNITIVITTFERVDLLTRAVYSALHQNYKDVSVLVVDNSSQDGTEQFMLKVASKYPNVTYHRNPQNIGGLNNFELAASLVQTDFFCFVNDDDFICQNLCSEVMPAFDYYPEIAIAAASTAYVDPEGNVISIDTNCWRDDGYLDCDRAIYNMSGGSHLTWTSCVFRTNAFRAVGGINKKIFLCCDVDVLVRLALDYPMWVSKRVCGFFVRHENSSCSMDSGADLYYHLNAVADHALSVNHTHTASVPARALAKENLNNYAKKMLFRKFFRNIFDGRLGNKKIWQRVFNDAGVHWLVFKGLFIFGLVFKSLFLHKLKLTNFLLAIFGNRIGLRKGQYREFKQLYHHISHDAVVWRSKL